MDAILNWLWQGCAIALGTALVLRATRLRQARRRYQACAIALLSIVALPAIPLLGLLFSAAPVSSAVAATPAAPVLSIPGGWWTSGAVALGAWALWFGIGSMRIARAWHALRRARRASTQMPVAIEAGLPSFSAIRSIGRPATVVLSNRVRAAAVVGGGRPVIAVNPKLLDELTPGELDRVLVHEWAHIQRRDDLADAMQLLLRAVAGWHPAVWWLDRQLRIERELACDDMAVAITGSAKAYAACLVRLASLPAPVLPTIDEVAAIASSGLRHRIAHLLSSGPPTETPLRRTTAVAATAVAAAVPIVLALSLAGVRAIEARSEPAPEFTGLAPASPTLSVAASDQRSALALADLPVSGGVAAPRTVVTSEPGNFSSIASARPQASLDRRDLSGRLQPPMVATRVGKALPAAASTPAGESVSMTAGEVVASRSGLALAALQPLQGTPGRTDGTPRLEGVQANAGSSISPVDEAAGGVEKPVSPWGAAADAGLAIGRGSQKAAVGTAGFFSRFSKAVAGSF